MKLVLAMFLGSHRFRLVTGCSLALMLIALAAALAIRLA
jgi:hypothetical protein